MASYSFQCVWKHHLAASCIVWFFSGRNSFDVFPACHPAKILAGVKGIVPEYSQRRRERDLLYLGAAKDPAEVISIRVRTFSELFQPLVQDGGPDGRVLEGAVQDFPRRAREDKVLMASDARASRDASLSNSAAETSSRSGQPSLARGL